MSFQEEAESLASKAHLTGTRLPALVGVVAVAVALVLFGAFRMVGALTEDSFQIEPAEGVEGEGSTEGASEDTAGGAEDAAPAAIYVHVGGEVVRPGVVQLTEGARVFDAVEAAGGLTEAASAESVNLARQVQDGEQITILGADEAAAQAASGAASSAGAASAGTTSSASSATASGGLVNINTADAAALVTLPGIGEKTAQKIIDDREANGPFSSVDDLTRVSGIGDKKLEAVRDLICV